MFTWPEIVLLVLKLLNAMMGSINDAKQFQAGVDSEIARQLAEIMRKTTAGRAMMEKVDAMSDAEVDAELRGLERKRPPT